MPTPRCFPTRPSVLQGRTTSAPTPDGKAFITINYLDNQPAEVFIILGKSGSRERAVAEAVGRLCSIALQHGTPLSALARQLRGISSEDTVGLGPNKLMSLPDALGKAIQTIIDLTEAQDADVHVVELPRAAASAG